MIDNKKPIVYISGWMGDGKNSGTYHWLEKHFKNIYAFSTGKCTDINNLRGGLRRLITEVKGTYGVNPVLVGNSYGGYLSTFMGLITVLINPVLYASETMPKIADISQEEIDKFRGAEYKRSMADTYWDRASYFPVLSDSDEIVGDHKITDITSNIPVIVPGGKHRLTDEERDKYLFPVLKNILNE